MLNKKNYQLLCDVCDRVLLLPCVTFECVAVSWLHIIREHPFFLEKYSDVFSDKKHVLNACRKYLDILTGTIVWVIYLIRSLYLNKGTVKSKENLPDKIDILFISHLLSASHADEKNDFYFGDMPRRLEDYGKKSLIMLINHSGKPTKSLIDEWEGESIQRIIFSDVLKLRDEVIMHFRLVKESLRLRKLAVLEKQGLMKNVLLISSKEALTSSTHENVRMAKQVESLVSKLRPKAIIVTYEGHAWERLVFCAARKSVPDVQCIGYQHALLFKRQHAIRRNLNAEYNPDKILTSGVVAQDTLKKSPNIGRIPIYAVGSNRVYNKYKNLEEKFSSDHQVSYKFSCLVVPEGILSECNTLFEFSLVCANLFPNVNFIWRLHPVLSFELLLNKNKNFRSLPKNIKLSNRVYEKDVEVCQWVLYRGTTAVVQAVVSGLRPIYLQKFNEMSIDPLYGLEDWRIKINSEQDFKRQIEKDISDQFHLIQGKEQIKAIEYCKKLFKPIDSAVLFTALA